MPANMVVGQGEVDGPRARRAGATTSRSAAAPPTPRSGRRWSTRSGWRTTCGCRWSRLVDGTGGGGSVKSLEQMGFTYVPFLPGMEIAVENHGDRARGGRGARARGGPRRGARGGVALLRDRARQRPAVRRRPAGGRGGDGRVARQGGARRRPRADARRRGRQRGGRRGRRARAAAALPLLPAGQRLGAAAGRGLHRPARTAARRRCCRSSRATRASRTRCGAILEAVLDRGSLFELGARHGRSAICALAPARRPAGRRDRLRPQALRRRADRRRLRQARALRRPLRPVPPAGREPRRPAGLRDRHRGRARRHDAPRRPRAVRGPPGVRAVGVGARAQGLRRRRRRPRRRLAAATSATRGRRATGARCRSRAGWRRPTGASSRPPRTRSRCGRRSRSA